MENFILLIVSICVSVWLFYKYKELQIKFKSVVSKNLSLKLDNNSMKTKMKYLETYKDDVSKTFKILDDELLLIKDNLTSRSQPPSQTQQRLNNQTQNVPRQSVIPHHRVSLLTPTVLNSLMSNETPVQQSQDVFNNIFNRFLTSNISSNDIELLRQQSDQREDQIQQRQEQRRDQHEQLSEEQSGRRLESIKEEPEEPEEPETQELPCLPNGYSKYLIGQDN